LEPNPDGVYDSRYLVEGGNVSLDMFAQEVPESSFEIQKVVPNCSSENLNSSATAFGVGSAHAYFGGGGVHLTTMCILQDVLSLLESVDTQEGVEKYLRLLAFHKVRCIIIKWQSAESYFGTS
jgi:hypothetical protein